MHRRCDGILISISTNQCRYILYSSVRYMAICIFLTLQNMRWRSVYQCSLTKKSMGGLPYAQKRYKVGGDNFVVSVKNISVTNILTVKIGISQTLFLCSHNDQHVFYILIFFRISIFDSRLEAFGGICRTSEIAFLRCVSR